MNNGSRSISSNEYTDVCLRQGQSNSHHITIYTDGASKYSSSNKYHRSFSGWGYAFFNGKVHPSRIGSLNTPYKTGYGGLTYSTALEAELTALEQALNHCKSDTTFHIYTDCQAMIRLLSQPASIEQNKKLEAKVRGENSPLSPNEFNELIEGRLITSIHSKIHNLCGSSLYLKWVKSHQDIDDKLQKNINHIQGNNVADRLANLGVEKGIEAYLTRICKDKSRQKLKRRISSRQIKIKSRIFKHSSFCSLVAVRFLAFQKGINPSEWKAVIGGQNMQWLVHAKELVAKRKWSEFELRYPKPISNEASFIDSLNTYSENNNDRSNRSVCSDRVSSKTYNNSSMAGSIQTSNTDPTL
ncbi:RNase H family protein [Vibrio splendidus]